MIGKLFRFRSFKFIIKIISFLLILVIAFIAYTNISVNNYSKKYIFKADNVGEIEKADAILILGALVVDEDTLSLVLQDRMDTGIELYTAGKAKKLLLSGDHGQDSYDEVNAMKDYALEHGVPAQDIFLDHAGFSTYESVYRAKDIFLCESVIIVSQEFHLPRAVYDANKMGLSAIGVIADAREYSSALKSQIREYAAISKDFLFVNIFKPLPKYLGDPIPVSGDGQLSNG